MRKLDFLTCETAEIAEQIDAFFCSRYWAYRAPAEEKKIWDILFCPIGPKNNDIQNILRKQIFLNVESEGKIRGSKILQFK